MSGDSQFLTLLQLADSALPTGGYAFSNGLESAARHGLFRTSDDLYRYCDTAIRQYCSSELPFVRSAHAVGMDGCAQETYLELMREQDAFLTIPETRHASLTQGRNCMRLYPSLFAEVDFGLLRETARTESCGYHMNGVLGAGLALAGLSADDVDQLACFLLLRDQVSSAIRLSVVGPTDATRLQSRLQEKVGQYIAEAPPVARDAYRSAPLLDVIQGTHSRLYTNLFQS